ncbi:hypothetical protein LTR65_000231 [Meristemomyces frigidus]
MPQTQRRIVSSSLTFYDNQENLRHEGLPQDDFGGITFLRLSKVAERAFCASCHAPLVMHYLHMGDGMDLTLGSVDEASLKDDEAKEAFKLKQHIFVSQKAWWYDVEKDGIPVHDRFTGAFDVTVKASEGKE